MLMLTAIAGVILITLLSPLAPDLKISFSLYAGLSLLGVGSAVLYLIGLKGFQHQFKVGYQYMATGMLLYALAVFEWPLFEMIRVNSTTLPAIYYLALLPFFAFFMLYYIGIRKIATIIDIRSKFRSLPGVITSACVLGLVVGLIPLPAIGNEFDPQALHITLGVATIGLTLLAASLTLLFHLMRNAGPLYKRAFAWNFYGFLAFFISQALDPSAFLPPDHWYVEVGSVLPFLLIAICFLKSAIEFNRIPYLEKRLQLGGITGHSSIHKTSVDIVMSVAALVSHPAAIDVTLDKVRNITSQLNSGQKPTGTQQEELAQVYNVLENYLVTEERARHYTREGLRQLIELQYKGGVNEPEFWRCLSQSSTIAIPTENTPKSSAHPSAAS